MFWAIKSIVNHFVIRVACLFFSVDVVDFFVSVVNRMNNDDLSKAKVSNTNCLACTVNTKWQGAKANNTFQSSLKMYSMFFRVATEWAFFTFRADLRFVYFFCTKQRRRLTHTKKKRIVSFPYRLRCDQSKSHALS